MGIGALEKVGMKVTTIDLNNVVKCDSHTLSGKPRFAGTRVPVEMLFNYIKAGETLDDFLDGFPGVSKEQAIAILDAGQETILSLANENSL